LKLANKQYKQRIANSVCKKIVNTDHITKNDVRKKTSNYVRKKLQTLYAKIEGTNENSTFKEGEAAFYILKMW